MASRVLTFPPPPDWPKIVTFVESRRRARWCRARTGSDPTMSSLPTLPQSKVGPGAAKVQVPADPETMVGADGHHVARARQVCVVVPERRSGFKRIPFKDRCSQT